MGQRGGQQGVESARASKKEADAHGAMMPGVLNGTELSTAYGPRAFARIYVRIHVM